MNLTVTCVIEIFKELLLPKLFSERKFYWKMAVIRKRNYLVSFI